jgi:biopolymer transport protein ExbD
MKFPRTVRVFHGQLDASPFVGFLFLLAILLLLNSSLVFIPGVPIRLPEAKNLPGVTGPTVVVAADANGRFYFRNQIVNENELLPGLRRAARDAGGPLTLVLLTDRRMDEGTLIRLGMLAREAGLTNALLATRPPVGPEVPKTPR